jgi:toxin ParE1/3/4
VKLSYSPAALADIESITDHIAADNPFAAERTVLAIRAKCAAAAANPLHYAPQDEFPGYRRAWAQPYGIWFQIDGDRVRIERILHGARDVRTLLGS